MHCFHKCLACPPNHLSEDCLPPSPCHTLSRSHQVEREICPRNLSLQDSAGQSAYRERNVPHTLPAESFWVGLWRGTTRWSIMTTSPSACPQSSPQYGRLWRRKGIQREGYSARCAGCLRLPPPLWPRHRGSSRHCRGTCMQKPNRIWPLSVYKPSNECNHLRLIIPIGMINTV